MCKHAHSWIHTCIYLHISYTLILLWKISNLEHFFSCRCCYAVWGWIRFDSWWKKEIYLWYFPLYEYNSNIFSSCVKFMGFSYLFNKTNKCLLGFNIDTLLMGPQEVVKLELLCKQLHEASDGVRRQEAEKALVEFQSGQGAATLTQCQMLLDRAQSSYSQYLAATTLTKLVSRNPCTLSLQQRIDIRKLQCFILVLLFSFSYSFWKCFTYLNTPLELSEILNVPPSNYFIVFFISYDFLYI